MVNVNDKFVCLLVSGVCCIAYIIHCYCTVLKLSWGMVYSFKPGVLFVPQ